LLQQRSGLKLWQERERVKREKDDFVAADVTMAVEAFIKGTPLVSGRAIAEAHLESHDFAKDREEGEADSVPDVEAPVKMFEHIVKELRPKIQEAYPENHHFILTDTPTFLQSLMAACGHYLNVTSQAQLDAAFARLLGLFKKDAADPLNLEGYNGETREIQSGRGKTIRQMTFVAFFSFLSGETSLKLDWMRARRFVNFPAKIS
jgi:hypothetical protein